MLHQAVISKSSFLFWFFVITNTQIFLSQNFDDVWKQFYPPKKHRRKATIKSSNDCFTCNELQRKCNWKKPYCIKCLEHNTDCSDYKTILTWNNKVTSRDKLRDLIFLIITLEEVSDQISKHFNLIYAHSSLSFFFSSEHETRKFTFVNENSDFSTIKLSSTSSSSKLSNAVSSNHSHNSRIFVETLSTVTYLTAFEQHNKDLYGFLANVSLFYDEFFIKHKSMK